MPPRNVASPEQSAAAREQVRNIPGQNKLSKVRPLSRFEREALTAPIESVYIYNISPIFKWQKDFPGLGTMTILPAPWRTASQFGSTAQLYNDPIELIRRMVRPYDGGNRVQRLMVETPLEIAQDMLACSPYFPGRPENNLQLYGCFYTIGKSLDDHSPDERQKILDEAEAKHVNICLEFIARADALADSPFKPVEVHKKCALFMGEERDWVARRGKLNATEECPFCGFENKRGIAKCRNCHEVIDAEKYAELQKSAKSKKAS